MQVFLKDYLGKFAGQTALYLGSGPTQFDYADAAKHVGPILAVNYTARHCPKNRHDTFVFSLHYDNPEIAASVRECDAVVCIASHHLKHYHACQTPPHLVYETGIISHTASDCSHDAEDMARSNTLWGIHNSLSFAISFLGLTGCKQLLCVGAGGNRKPGYDARLTSSKGGHAPYNINVLKESCLRYKIQWRHIDI